MLESVAMNHPFVDGNKRITVAVADVFLRMNGWRLARPSDHIYGEMIAMFDACTFDFAHLEPWLRAFTRQR